MNVIDPQGVVQADVARAAAVRNLKWLWPPALLAGALVIRYFFMMGLGGSDDTDYMLNAMQLAAGKPPASFDVGSGRAAFMVWLAVWDYLGFGGSALLFPQLMVEVALVGAIYWVGRRFVDERAALLATTCWILFPIELVYGGIVLPDQLALLLAMLSLGFALAPLRSEHVVEWRLMMAGVLAGLATSVREPYFLLPVIIGSSALWTIKPLKIALGKSFVFGAAALMSFLLEYPFFYLWTGDWLYRHHLVRAKYGAEVAAQAYRFALGRLLYYLGVSFEPSVSGLFGWLLLIGFVTSFRYIRERPVLVIWTGAFYIFLQFAPTGLHPYQTLPMQPRYILPIVVLLFFPLGFLLARLSEAKPLGISGTVLLLAAVALQGFNVTFQRISGGVYSSDIPNAVSAVLQSRAADWPKRPGISLDTFRILPHDFQSRVQDWPRIDWSKDFLCSDGGAWLASVNALLVPRAETSKGPDSAASCAVQWLQRNAVAHPVVVPVTRWDNLLVSQSIERIRHLAHMQSVGVLYVMKSQP